MPKIVIVDENDNVIGATERSVARARGLRHRIARVFLINSEGKVMLQKRSSNLVDNPGKWDHSVGGHVDEGEDYYDAAIRETKEELGIDVKDLKEIGEYYIEREAPGGFARRFIKVFVGKWDGPVNYDESEVAEVGWFSHDEIEKWHKQKSEDFTQTFGKAFGMLNSTYAKSHTTRPTISG